MVRTAQRGGGVAVELALAGVAQITVVNRSRDRGEELINLLNARTPTMADYVLWEGMFASPNALTL
ncbi:MAG: hypothetical protein P8M25_11650 [Paracoccaceae bacterium]|nr:hypothetical protein [Paracoccaceae bacterium]